jgi:tRNA pseudouridine38-40 synthase
MRIALQLEYDGTPFHGWQSQPGGCTVQDALERALGQIAGGGIRTVCAGRTDAGVHALMQVVHFDAPHSRPLNAWIRGVNAHLPASIVVVGAAEVADTFHARFDAQARTYRYLLATGPVRPALAAGRVGWHHQVLGLAPMREALAALLGVHDFSAFRSSECQARSPVRHLMHADIRQQGSLFVFEFTANGFLHHMVRNLVGCLLRIGSGRESPDWLGQLLEARDRTRAAATFAPEGLYLWSVDYPDASRPALPGPRMPALIA